MGGGLNYGADRSIGLGLPSICFFIFYYCLIGCVTFLAFWGLSNQFGDPTWISLDLRRVKWFVFTYGGACSCLADLDCGLQDIKI